jgi:hypothetical protein
MQLSPFSFYGFGLRAFFNLEVTSETMNPCRHLVKLLVGHKALVNTGQHITEKSGHISLFRAGLKPTILVIA